MSSLFAVFSPLSWLGLPLNWASIFIMVMVLPSTFWATSSQPKQVLKMTLKAVYFEFSALLGHLSAPGLVWIFITMFGYVAVTNLLGLLPYGFTASSHLSVTMALAFPIWLGHVVMSWVIQPNYAFAHLVPSGTPAALLVFMVLIELLSNIIRPLTLSVRLAANMIAGHLLFVLVSSQVAESPLSLALLALIALGALELGVALIQAYVFSLLSVLYVQEVQTVKIATK